MTVGRFFSDKRVKQEYYQTKSEGVSIPNTTNTIRSTLCQYSANCHNLQPNKSNYTDVFIIFADIHHIA